ncbi:MAG TPA: type IX secretion system membrane protein PorP/SprF [Bacteroidales bacterium]|nr:type IX secretion system membrane protein PorP/SprF [Bacteroidales bacterium]
MFRRIAFLLFILPCTCLKLLAQDPEFSQFYANPLYLNPALAGATVCPKANGNYRNQWPAIGKAFVTYNISYDQYVATLHGGLGAVVTADRAGGGNLNATSISLMYAYKFNISTHLQASGALKVGYYQRRLNWGNLQFEDMIDPVLGFTLPTSEKQPDNLSVGVPDFSTGIFLGYDELFYGGIAVDHLTQPKVGFYTDNKTQLHMKFTIHAGSVINLHKNGSATDEREFSLSPNILYQQQFQFHQLNVGLYLTVDPVIAGLWFRHNFENADALIPMLGLHYKNLRIGYSYDFTISRLKGASGGAHEVSASWQFPCLEKRRHIRAIKCPRF